MASRRASRYGRDMPATQGKSDDRRKRWEELERRFAETDRRLAIRFREIDETIEQCKRAERRLAKYL